VEEAKAKFITPGTNGLKWDLLRSLHYPKEVTYKDSKYPFYFNAVQMLLTKRDLVNLEPKPRYFFILGDLVMGFARDDGSALRNQLGDFTHVLDMDHGMHGIITVPLPGNHETTFKAFVKNAEGKFVAQSGAHDADNAVWVEWVKAPENLRKDGINFLRLKNYNGPEGPDALPGVKLTTDQKEMTYSFDEPLADGANGSLVHFIILNSDTTSDKMGPEGYEELGLLPLAWVTKDIQAAEKNPLVKHIFVMSHKPVRPPVGFLKPEPADRLNEVVAEKLRELMVNSKKVRALLCSHAHMWSAESLVPDEDPKDYLKFDPKNPRISPRQTSHAQPMQIIMGNAGMNPEKFWDPANDPEVTWRPDEEKKPFFGFTVISVHRSGKVTYNSYQRPIPSPYYAGSDAKALPRSEPVEILPKKD
jgi:hypothetical protein